jgi:hypothetical protein
MSWQIQEGINFGHGDSLWTVGKFCNVIAGTNFAFLQHADVEPWSVMCHKKGCHTRFIHADAHAEARNAWLRYFKFSTTDAVSIADAHLVIRKSFDSEVFSELAESKIVAAQKALPVMVRIHLVDEYGAVLPAVTGEIGLRITIDIELAHHPPSRDRRLPDCGSDSFAVPCDSRAEGRHLLKAIGAFIPRRSSGCGWNSFISCVAPTLHSQRPRERR